MVSLREKYPLESRKPLKKTIEKFWFWFLFLIFLILPISFTLPRTRGWSYFLSTTAIISSSVIFLVLIFLSIYVYEIFYMKYYYYDIIGTNLRIRKGLFSRNEITLPFNRLQDVYIDQDVWDRIFGLYDVHVSSATYISGWLAHIDGLNKQNSEIIKELILNRIGKDDK